MAGAPLRSLVEQLWQKFQRDRELPLTVRGRKAARYLEQLAASKLHLRSATRVGRRARTRGTPYVENRGRLIIGDDFNLVSIWVQSHLVVGPSGLLEIGDSVSINYGAAISVDERISIGSRVRIGPYAMLMDSDFHTAGDRSQRPSAPIVLEDEVWLAARVTVLKGCRIGKGSVITAGSVVSSDIPPGVIAGGVPARVLRKIDAGDPAHLEAAAEAPLPVSSAVASNGAPAPAKVNGNGAVPPELVERVRRVVATTFSIEPTVDLDFGPRQIPKWDSMGHLRLTVGIEQEFNITLSEAQLMGMKSVRGVCEAVRDSVGAPP
jgi:maltose O-acetyltransferase